MAHMSSVGAGAIEIHSHTHFSGKEMSREKVDKLLSGTATFLFPAVVIGLRQGPARDIFWRRRTSRSVPMARTCLHDKLQERGGGA